MWEVGRVPRVNRGGPLGCRGEGNEEGNETMKAAELREMSDEQLALTLKETTDTLFRLKIRSQTERLDAPSELRRQRRLIARIMTIQTEREQSK